MALTKTHTTGTVRKLQEGRFSVSSHLKIEDGADVLYDGDVSVRWDGVSAASTVRINLGQKMQGIINRITAERNLYNSTAFQGLDEWLDANTTIGA